ncbi:MAG: proton-conducting transporter membrane subunit [Eubacteriales bacterium]
MEFVYNFPFFSILLSLGAGVASFGLNGKNAQRLNMAVSGIVFLLNGALLVQMYYVPTQITYLMGHFTAPWGNELCFGTLEALMATVFALVMLLSVATGSEKVYNKGEASKINYYFLMMNLLLSSTLALIYTNDLFTAYVFVEINTLCACGFVAARNTRKAIVATIKYLIMSLLGSGLFLMSVSILYVLTGHLVMPDIKVAITELVSYEIYTMPITIVVGLIAVSMAIKSALFPFHNWVPNAYDRAYNLSNALSSGLVLKSYIFLLIKIFYRVIGISAIHRLNILNILFFFGLLSMVIASLHAVKENNIKKMLSYSSIAQIGYIYVGIGLGSTGGFLAAAYIILSHSLVKAMLFLSCEGLMLVSNNSKDIRDLKSSGFHNPLAGFAFALGTFSMMGFPLLTGFYGKYLLAVAGTDAPARTTIILVALAISTLLNSVYFLRVLLVIYTKGDNYQKKTFAIPKSYQINLAIFIGVNLIFAFLFTPITEQIRIGLSLL